MWPILISLAIGIGALFIGRLFAPPPTPQQGPRLSNLNPSTVSPGNPITRLWGSMKLPTQLIWASNLLESQSQSFSYSGGFLGFGEQTSINTQYSYYVNFAVSVCQGPVYQFRRIWANDKLIWTNPNVDAAQTFDGAYYGELRRLYEAGVSDVTGAYQSAYWFAFNNFRGDNLTLAVLLDAYNYITQHHASMAVPPIPWPNANESQLYFSLAAIYKGQVTMAFYSPHKLVYYNIHLYHGTPYQRPDAILETALGVGNVPAFRNVAYIVFDRFMLADFGNQIPTIRVELQTLASDPELRYIIGRLCEDSGLTPAQYDTSRIPNTLVKGYSLVEPTSGREGIYRLQKVFPFDAAESAYKLMFQWILANPRARIRREDFGAHADQGDMPSSEEMVRVDDAELPAEMVLRYQDAERNYSLNTARITRQVTNSNSVEQIDAQVALSREDAKKWLTEQMVLRFMSRRITKIMLPRKYVIIEPTDAVSVPSRDDPTVTYDLRCLEQRIGADGMVELTFMDHATHVVTTAFVDDDLVFPEDDSATNKQSSATLAYLMDLPLFLNDEPDSIGFYVVLDGSRNGWTGGALMVQSISGQSTTGFGEPVPLEGGIVFTTVATNDVLGADGNALSVMGPGHGMCWDRASVLMVLLLNPGQELTTSTEDIVMATATNSCLLGNELFCFVNAVDKGNGLWELNTFLRGLRGTEGHCNTHDYGEVFVRLTTRNIRRVVHDEATLNIEKTYRALTNGDLVADSEDILFTNTGNSLRPRAPIIFKKDRDASNTITLTWVPRNRQLPISWGKTLPTIVDQPYEKYEIDVYQAAVLKETYAFTDLRTWTYTSGMQTGDGVVPADPVTLNLYQMGQTIGRGYVEQVVI